MSERKCIVEGCEKWARKKKMCPPHYNAADIGAPLLVARCREPGCTEFGGERTGFCRDHYRRSWRAELRKEPCTLEGCEKPKESVRYCAEHQGLLGRNWSDTGSRKVGKDGYVYVYMPSHPNASYSGKVLEHRMIMSNHIGRALDSEETVHHKNGVKTDNRIENLELWSQSHPKGQRIEDKIEWCKEFLSKYGKLNFDMFEM